LLVIAVLLWAALLWPVLSSWKTPTCFYAIIISRFDWRQLGVGRGDQWITGGALAISALAAAKLAGGAKALAILGHGSTLKEVAIVLWVLTILWLPVLALAEVLRPRLYYDVGRWSTVFPVGMYAACSFAVGMVAAASGITSFARVWVWVALAVWAIVFAALVGRTFEILSSC
jgi:tellurite resistance protein TehA-like permease